MPVVSKYTFGGFEIQVWCEVGVVKWLNCKINEFI